MRYNKKCYELILRWGINMMGCKSLYIRERLYFTNIHMQVCFFACEFILFSKLCNAYSVNTSSFFSSPEHFVLRVSYCDRPLSVVCHVVRRPSSVNFFTLTSSPLKPLIGFWLNFTGMIPGWSPTKVVQMVLIGCICRSRGQKAGFQNAIFKNLLVWNYKAQSFHIWYIASASFNFTKGLKMQILRIEKNADFFRKFAKCGNVKAFYFVGQKFCGLKTTDIIVGTWLCGLLYPRN